MISADALSGMRATAELALPDTCQVQRATKASDGAGGFTEVWATVATVACRLSPSGGAEKIIAEKLSQVNPVTITVPVGTSVQTGDRIVVRGRIFEFQALTDRGAWGIVRKLICVEIL